MLQTSLPIKSEQASEVRPNIFVRLLRWILQFVLMIALVAGALAFMSRSMEQKSEDVGRSFQRTPLTVTASTVVLNDNRPSFISYGRIVAANQLDIKSSVTGKVVWLSPNLLVGKTVSENEELIRIDDFSYVSNVSESEAEINQTKAAIAEARLRLIAEETQLKGAEAQLEIARTDLARAVQLVEQGVATRKQIDDREVIVSQRQLTVQQRKNNIEIEGARQAQQLASLSRLELRLERAQRALTDTSIKSPIAGRVGLIAIETGQEVNTQNVLARLDRTDSLDVDFTLTDAQFGRLLEDDQPLIGRKVKIKWVVGSKESLFKATIRRLGAEINTEFGGVQVFASLDDPNAIEALRPGAFVEVKIPDRNYLGSTLLPETSVYDGNIVYRIDENGRLIQTQVDVVAYSGGQAIIASGVDAGQKILTTRLSRITGRPVKIIGEKAQSVENKGKPAPEFLERVKKENGLNDEEWQSKSGQERRKLIQEFRNSGGQ